MSQHLVSPLTYWLVFAALIALTVLTVAVSFVELGPAHVYVGMAIAVTKASLVVLVFMHVWYSSRVTWVMVLAMLFWLGILIVLTLSDYLTRWPGATYG